MIAILTTLFAGLGRRFAYWGALVAAVCIAVSILLRQGKHAAEAELAIANTPSWHLQVGSHTR